MSRMQVQRYALRPGWGGVAHVDMRHSRLRNMTISTSRPPQLTPGHWSSVDGRWICRVGLEVTTTAARGVAKEAICQRLSVQAGCMTWNAVMLSAGREMVQARVQRAFPRCCGLICKVPDLSLSWTRPTCWAGGNDAIGRGLVDHHGTVRPVRGRVVGWGRHQSVGRTTASGRRER